jgi:hypothetical protein
MVASGRASSALRQIFGNASDLRVLISALLIVSAAFPRSPSRLRLEGGHGYHTM